MTQFIDNTDWSKVARMDASAFKGFSFHDFVSKELKDFVRAHGTDEMEFAMCPRGRGQDDVNKWADLMTAVGWRFLTIENFGSKNLKDFRENMPLRFHPTVDSDGRLRFRNSWIMYMRKDVRDHQLESQAEAAYASFAEMQRAFEAPVQSIAGVRPGFGAEASPLQLNRQSLSDVMDDEGNVEVNKV